MITLDQHQITSSAISVFTLVSGAGKIRGQNGFVHDIEVGIARVISTVHEHLTPQHIYFYWIVTPLKVCMEP